MHRPRAPSGPSGPWAGLHSPPAGDAAYPAWGNPPYPPGDGRRPPHGMLPPRPKSSYEATGRAGANGPPAFPMPQMPHALTPGSAGPSRSSYYEPSSYGPPPPGPPHAASAPAVPQYASYPAHGIPSVPPLPPHYPSRNTTSFAGSTNPHSSPPLYQSPEATPFPPRAPASPSYSQGHDQSSFFPNPHSPEGPPGGFYNSLMAPGTSTGPPPPTPPPPPPKQDWNGEPHRQASQHAPSEDEIDREEEEMMAQVLAMSLKHEQEQRVRAMTEEEELARALQESARLEDIRGAARVPSPPLRTSPIAFPEVQVDEPSPPLTQSPPSEAHEIESMSSHAPSSLFSHTSAHESVASGNSGSCVPVQPATMESHWNPRRDEVLSQMQADEELARRLAEEEAQESYEPATGPNPVGSPAAMDTLPSYAGSLPPGAASPAVFASPIGEVPSVLPTTNATSPLVSRFHRTQSATAVMPNRQPLPPPPRASSAGWTRPRPSSSSSSGSDAPPMPSLPSNSPLQSPSLGISRPSSVASSVSVASNSTHGSSGLAPVDERLEVPSRETTPMPSPPAQSPAAQPTLSDELLTGVSLGFGPPPISSVIAPFQGPFPNVMALPYGKCPPLHFQAPSWRQLLMIMARSSSSRVEPTVEALAMHKNDLKLRIVVQFVKVHHASSDWRTILYLTLDHPVPRSAPGAHRWIETDTNVLPFSYTLSTLPALLRGAADTAVSRTYTIPASERTPLPKLPIDLPNLMVYLQSALEDSRAASNEANGTKRLAKMVKECYPDDQEEDGGEDGADRPTGVRRLFGYLRGKDKNKDRATSNQDTYQLITPFFAESG